MIAFLSLSLSVSVCLFWQIKVTSLISLLPSGQLTMDFQSAMETFAEAWMAANTKIRPDSSDITTQVSDAAKRRFSEEFFFLNLQRDDNSNERVVMDTTATPVALTNGGGGGSPPLSLVSPRSINNNNVDRKFLLKYLYRSLGFKSP